jgi:hypothetical protein
MHGNDRSMEVEYISGEDSRRFGVVVKNGSAHTTIDSFQPLDAIGLVKA